MALERLQKIIAAAGIASRRKAEELIQSGLVSVNGKTVTELGSKADPAVDSIRVNQKLLKGPERQEYVALNKPRGYVTTVSDPEGRPTVMELVRSNARLYPIGRLDFNSEGLLLLTNDGELAHKLMKAASHIPKTYLVKVAGLPAEEQLRHLRAGVSIAEERDPKRRVRTASAQIRVIKEADNPWLEVTLHEGRNRQIRKMFEEIGHHVEKIRRVRYGPLQLDLPPGESRSLTPREISQLKHATEPAPRAGFRTEIEAQDDRRRGKPPRRPFSRREHEGQALEIEDSGRKRIGKPAARQRTGLHRAGQRDSESHSRTERRPSYVKGSFKSLHKQKKWDGHTRPVFRDQKQGKERGNRSDFRSPLARTSGHTQWRGPQSREHRPEFRESSHRSDTPADEERFADKRRDSRRGNRDRRS